MTQKNNYDLVLYGATSFVGRIVASNIYSTYGINTQLKWAIAGRNRDKLTQLKECLIASDENIDIIVADAFDEHALSQLCQRTRLVISTVGPYALYGESLFKSCANSGTHYCDLCGEVQWIHQMIDRYSDDAKRSGAILVNACGFDSIPSDLGVAFIQNYAQKHYHEYGQQISMRCKAIKGGLSGGTIASMLHLFEQASSNRELRKLISNPYALCEPGHPFKTRQTVVKGAFYDQDFKQWCSAFIMAGINTRIVHRSHSKLDTPYSLNFKYSEAFLNGKGKRGWLKSQLRSSAFAVFFLMVSIKSTRALLQKYILAKPSEGPSKQQQLDGFYDLRFVAHTPSKQQIRLKITGQGDPGYSSTSKMLVQAAISIIKGRHKKTSGGIYTPASIFNEDFILALENYAQIKFEIID